MNSSVRPEDAMMCGVTQPILSLLYSGCTKEGGATHSAHREDSLFLSLFSSVSFFSFFSFAADPEGPGVCAMLLTMLAFVLVLVTMPFSLCVTVKVS